MEFFNQIEHVRLYIIYTHDTTLKMAFRANYFADFNAGPPSHKCRKKGHFAWECCLKGDGEKPKSQENNHVHVNVDKDNDGEDGENLFIQHKKPKKGVVDKNYLLLDNQSTVNQVANHNLLKNIRKGEKPIIIHCNAGSTKTNLIGELGRMTVHHNLRSIANVLSLKSVVARHCVTYDREDRGGVFQVHTPNGIEEFKPSKHGLHYLDMAEHGDPVQHMLVTTTGDHEDKDSKDKEEGNEDEEEGNEDEESNDLMMVNTVRKNSEGFTKHEIKMAQEARRL